MSRIQITTTALLVLTLLLPAATARGQRAHRMVSLKQAYQLAMQHHPSIKVLHQRVEQARAGRYKAWSAIKPTAGMSGSFTHWDEEIKFEIKDPLTGKTVEAFDFQKQNQFGFNLMAKVPLFVGPAYPGISAANKMVRLAELSEQDFRRGFQLQVANAYYLIVSQKEVARSLEAKLKVDRKHLAAARARLDAGQAARSAVLRADLVATQDEQALRVARNNLAAARRQLAILLGLKGTLDVTRPAEPPHPERSPDKMLRTALGQRPDYKASALSISAAQSGQLATWLGFAPTVDASWLFRWSEASAFADKKWSWSLIFTVNLPLYDGGARYADLRANEAKISAARHQRRALRDTIEGQLVRLRAEVASAEAGVVSTTKAVKLARTTAADMEVSYEAGAATQLDVLDATQRQLEAQIQHISSRYKRDMARLALSNAMGLYNPTGGK